MKIKYRTLELLEAEGKICHLRFKRGIIPQNASISSYFRNGEMWEFTHIWHHVIHCVHLALATTPFTAQMIALKWKNIRPISSCSFLSGTWFGSRFGSRLPRWKHVWSQSPWLVKTGSTHRVESSKILQRKPLSSMELQCCLMVFLDTITYGSYQKYQYNHY